MIINKGNKLCVKSGSEYSHKMFSQYARMEWQVETHSSGIYAYVILHNRHLAFKHTVKNIWTLFIIMDAQAIWYLAISHNHLVFFVVLMQINSGLMSMAAYSRQSIVCVSSKCPSLTNLTLKKWHFWCYKYEGCVIASALYFLRTTLLFFSAWFLLYCISLLLFLVKNYTSSMIISFIYNFILSPSHMKTFILQ